MHALMMDEPRASEAAGSPQLGSHACSAAASGGGRDGHDVADIATVDSVLPDTGGSLQLWGPH